MKQERSAGIIVFRDDPGGAPMFLLLDYGRYWDFPKGHVEKGEDDRAAALRELAEETGIRRVELLEGFQQRIVYFFRSRGGLVRKSVVFFLGRTRQKRVVTSDEHSGSAWVCGEQALRQVKYPTARAVLQAAIRHLEESAQDIARPTRTGR
jgi:8-oxo-dGTP pyrophosphatase MutT (NUDIX family)